MKHVVEHFRKVDPVLYAAIQDYPFPKSSRGTNLFADLCEIIIQQQLSERVGDVLFERFIKLFVKQSVTAENLLKISDSDIRTIGISRSKIGYMKNVGRAVIDKSLVFGELGSLTDEEIVKNVTKIKGLGHWSAEMFLMFSLGREDVFSYGDLGLRRAIQKLYKLKKEPMQKKALKLSMKWKPYRTYACRILWNSLG